MPVSKTLSRPILLATRTMQWISAVITMGIYSYFVKKQHHGVHIIFNEVIAVLSVVFFLPAFLSPFRSTFSKFVVPIDFIFSYLWLTAFVFAAQSYSYGNVRFQPPSGVNVPIKHAAEAFVFLTFFFTALGLAFETATRWTDRDADAVVAREKPAETRAPLDAPAPAANV
ncbi:hypothetical protein UA08_02221 [Talaromyces atroroseus]|uniref:MARVEL domain-containing protein n=1 Tax=Talaromyces atroroseus TaxID=1441469 RepID=A0A225B659_TALAT|nr:hypothetical protein UA08_02221 [Talaromyces atroroseus]OKL62355.1 hypothetical protein UA08_02221 [Talaromyces atroroseus]